MKIYVASSWRNMYQQNVVKELRAAGHEVYDFKNPGENKPPFAWDKVDTNWKNWTNKQYLNALKHPLAEQGYRNDFDPMGSADACVLVMPCGRSAHVEAGWMQGAVKPTIILLGKEAELMYKLFETVTDSLDTVIEHLKEIEHFYLLPKQ